MSGYLEGYGAGEERRAKLIKRAIAIVVAVGIAAGVLYYYFHNYREERVAKQFLSLLAAGNYQAAYGMWHASPTSYPFDKFMDDWGPKSSFSNASEFQIANADACGSGVLMSLSYPQVQPVAVWVERSTKVMSFSPWPQCPGRHFHPGAFFKMLFGGGK
ncbi:MAG: hypothetical protein ABI165_12265 [Bryobacteraceae bacterium]